MLAVLPKIVYTAGGTDIAEDDAKYVLLTFPVAHSRCGICLSDYEEEETLSMLPCRHHFHEGCVVDWLKINKHCPFCRVSEIATGFNLQNSDQSMRKCLWVTRTMCNVHM